VAITASSVGAHGSAGAADPLGGDPDDSEPEGPVGGLGIASWLVSSGTAARAVRDGCTVNVDASLEKSAQPALRVSSSTVSTAGTARRGSRRGSDRLAGCSNGDRSDIAVHRTARPDRHPHLTIVANRQRRPVITACERGWFEVSMG
jgi:hypothetical protein